MLGGGGKDSASQLYAQVDKKAKKKKKVTATEMSTLATFSDEERSGVHTPEAGTAMYDRVGDKKKENDISTNPNTSEGGTTDQLYAQVDKKKRKKKGEAVTHPHIDTAVDQLYAQVDKKKKNHPEADTAVVCSSGQEEERSM